MNARSEKAARQTDTTPLRAIWLAGSRRIPVRYRLQLVYAESVVGVLLGVFGGGWPVLAVAAIISVILAMTALIALKDRWYWPWLDVGVLQARASRHMLRQILGRPFSRTSAERWLEQSKVSPSRSRFMVLAALGRREEADALVPASRGLTAEERASWLLPWLELHWRQTGEFDPASARSVISAIDQDRRVHLSIGLEFLRGSILAFEGRDLRTVEPFWFARGALPLCDHVALWRARLWPLQYFFGFFVLTWMVLAVAHLIAG